MMDKKITPTQKKLPEKLKNKQKKYKTNLLRSEKNKTKKLEKATHMPIPLKNPKEKKPLKNQNQKLKTNFLALHIFLSSL
jgi:hypothetical protein